MNSVYKNVWLLLAKMKSMLQWVESEKTVLIIDMPEFERLYSLIPKHEQPTARQILDNFVLEIEAVANVSP